MCRHEIQRHFFSSVQSLSHVWFFVTPWTVACHISLPFTLSQSLLKFTSIESMMPSNHLIPFSSCFQSFPASEYFSMSQFFVEAGQSIGASTSASVILMNIQDWFPLGLTGLISLMSKELSRVFSNMIAQKHQFFGCQLSLRSSSHIHTVQFSSVSQSCPTLCDSMNHSTPGLPVHHQHLESTQTHVHWVSDAIQQSYPLSSPSLPALNLSQHQGLFQWVSSSHQVAKVL